jgi:hypothetical protein
MIYGLYQCYHIQNRISEVTRSRSLVSLLDEGMLETFLPAQKYSNLILVLGSTYDSTV